MRISDWSSDVCSSDLLPTDQRRQRRIRPDVPAKPERASKPVERHLRGACRAAPAVGCDMRDDMVTHLAERCPRQVRAQAQIEGALDCEEEVGVVAITDPANRIEHLRSEEHTSELQSLMRISYAVFCLKKKKKTLDQKQAKHY